MRPGPMITTPTLWTVLALCAVVGAAVVAPPGVTASPGQASGREDIYAAWERVLVEHVDDEGLVDYRRLQEGPGRADLEAFMQVLADIDPAALATDAERRALWINAYNAVVMWQVVERYPIDSVRDVGTLFGLIGGFFKKQYPVAGSRMSADDIEHDTLRARWPQDAEIHWALVCAAFGCPRLPREPYRAEDLDAVLDARGREFLASARGMQLDRDEAVLYLSSYFDWYEGDFERVAGTVVDYVLRFAPEPDAQWIREHRSGLQVRILPYDWTLNDQAVGPRSSRPAQRR